MKRRFGVALLCLAIAVAPWACAARADEADRKTLRKWQPMAQRGDAAAQYNLGLLYLFGQGVPPDYDAAARLFRKSAEQGYVAGQFSLCHMYATGRGVWLDYGKAILWCRKAAEQGSVAAQFNLGVFYGNGSGVTRDNVRAHFWLNLAAARGHEQAGKNRDYIGRRMTPAEIAKAQKMAREWLVRHAE